MMEPFQNANLSCKRCFIVVDSGTLDLMVLDNLDGIPLARRTRHGLHDSCK
jgi:hypothetical protein